VAKPREDTIGLELDSNSYKDYAGIINRLKGQLSEHNLSLNANKEVCRENGEVLKISASMSDDEKLHTAEMINVAKQISLYEQLNSNQVASAFASNQMEVNRENYENAGKPEEMKAMYEEMRDKLHSQIFQCSQKEAVLKSQINRLQDERLQINSVKIVEKVQDDTIVHEDTKHLQNSRSAENEVSVERDEVPHREEKGQRKADYEKQIDRGQNMKSAQSFNQEKEMAPALNERE